MPTLSSATEVVPVADAKNMILRVGERRRFIMTLKEDGVGRDITSDDIQFKLVPTVFTNVSAQGRFSSSRQISPGFDVTHEVLDAAAGQMALTISATDEPVSGHSVDFGHHSASGTTPAYPPAQNESDFLPGYVLVAEVGTGDSAKGDVALAAVNIIIRWGVA